MSTNSHASLSPAPAFVPARDNPFAVHRVHALRYRFLSEDWPQLAARLASLNHRAAIVGPQGSGKTMLLLELAERWRAAGYRVRHWQLRRDQPQRWRSLAGEFARPAEPQDWILLDGAEQLGFWNWHRVSRWSRTAAALIITRHRPGQLPLWIRTRTTVELLDDLVCELLGSIDAEARERNRRWFRQYQGNLRLILRRWFDEFGRDA
jgi:hypothetical protein